MTKNRIIFDCERMKYENTGLYHYCLNLGNHLQKQLNTQNEELTYYIPYSSKHIFGVNYKYIIQTELHKWRLPALDDYTVWHACYQDSHYVPARNKKIKVALSVHDLNFMYDPSKTALKKKQYLKRLQKLVTRADVIICMSKYSCNDVLFYCDTKNKPVHIIHNGTNTLTKPQLLKESYRPAKPFIFSVGTISPKKNFHTLLPLIQEQQQLELVIAGKIEDSDYYQTILDNAQKSGVIDNIKILGPVNENEKSWYFNHCCAFAFPSNAEGFGLSVAEAMSVGKPLFLSDKTALPEIGGEVAFYFENFSAAHMNETFATGMKQYVKLNMQQQIIKKGKEYDWDIAAKEYWKIYRSLY